MSDEKRIAGFRLRTASNATKSLDVFHSSTEFELANAMDEACADAKTGECEVIEIDNTPPVEDGPPSILAVSSQSSPLSNVDKNEGGEHLHELPPQDAFPLDSKKRPRLTTAESRGDNNKILAGMVFTISGIENPERARLRSLALEMGAEYTAQWEGGRCTHLVTPFRNTPKCRQMMSSNQGGIAVLPQFIDDCHRAGRRLGESLYRLDDWNGKAKDRDDDVGEEEDSSSDSDGSTDNSESTTIDILSSDTDSNSESDGDYNRNPPDLTRLPALPMFFTGYKFTLSNELAPEDRRRALRLIYAANGEVIDDLQLANTPTFRVLPKSDVGKLGDSSSTHVLNVNVDWIEQCYQADKFCTPPS